ncbi:MAG: hypothetical protein NTU98_01465 [Bacteroidetes bacterium]|nr:hypothetical protein [Bacteroidota bacterium]
MMQQKYPKIVLLCLAALLLAFFASNRLFRADPQGWRLIISSDGLGYYSYLPAFIIDHDATYKKVTEREAKILRYDRYKPSYLVRIDGRIVNKYFSGEALLLLPFFLLATIFSWIGGIEITGYSFFFQLFTGLGALFYLLLGLYFLKKILDHLKIHPVLISILLPVILLGTNLFYYSLWQPTMSHVYSFFAINGFLWMVCRIVREGRQRNFLLAGLFLGLTVLIRPTNGIVILLIPFLINSKEEREAVTGFIREKKISLLLFAGIFFLVVLIQPVLWHIQTGRWLIWSYRAEGFHFRHPELTNVLFGFRKGLFIYTPLILLSMLGLIRMLFMNRTRFFSMALFIIVSTWIIAAWWNWYYGDSFGARAFIDYYGIYTLLLALLLDHKWRKGSAYALSAFLFCFVALNLLQTWQFTQYIIHPYSMNKAKYQYVFLKTDTVYRNCLGGIDELPGYRMDMTQPVAAFRTDLEEVKVDWNNSTTREVSYAHSGKTVGYLDSINVYSATLQIHPEQLSALPVTFYVKGSIWIRDSLPGSSNQAFFVMSMDSLDQNGNYWYGFPVNDIPLNPARTWRECRFSLTLPEFRTPSRTLKIYVWNNGKKPFMVDDFSLEFYTEKKKSGGN